LSRDTIDTLFSSARNHSRVVTLTERQRDVVRLLARGNTMKEIAAALDMSSRTVAFHKYRVMEKLKMRGNAELVRFAVKHSLV
jgi:DNA-binding CsgD family transcriptional regulator